MNDPTRDILANLIGQLFLQNAELQAQIIMLQQPKKEAPDE